MNELILVSRANLVEGGYQLIERFSVDYQTAHALRIVGYDVGGTQIISEIKGKSNNHKPIDEINNSRIVEPVDIIFTDP